MISHIANAGSGALALLMVFAGSMAFYAGSVRGDIPRQLGDMLVAGLVQMPGIMVINPKIACPNS